MKRARLWTLGCWLLLAFAPAVRAQMFSPIPAGELSGSAALMPMAGPDGGMFLGPGVPAGPDMRGAGNVGGRSASGLGNIEIGFDYIRPYWSFRDFTLAVPTASVGSFPLLGDVGHVDDHFSLAPRLNYRYDVSDIFAVKATGAFMNLSGHLDRSVTAADGSVGTLSANSSMTIVTATFPEISARFYYDEIFTKQSHFYCPKFDDLVIDLSLGTRYSSIEQNYTGSLSNTVAGGNNQTTRYSHQAFKGVGFTSGLNFTLPVKQNWLLFNNLRGSILVGDNSKDSTLAVTLAGVPGVSNSITQSKTEFIPVGEMELGAQWVHEFGDVNRPDILPALFTVRIGMTGHIWGNVGPLSAGSPQAFRTSNLFLLGAHIMVGLQR